MKKVVVGFVSAAALATISMAMAGGMTGTGASDNQAVSNSNVSGVYVSGDLGVGMVDYKKSDFNDPITGAAPSSFKKYAFAWGANLGYQYNQYVAVELGYLSFGQAKSNTSYNGIPLTVKSSFGGFDAVLKGILPVNSAFNLFAKAGAVDMHAHPSVSGPAAPFLTTKSQSTWMPLIGAGAAYNVNSNVALTVQDDYAFRTHGKNGFIMPAANDVLAGVSYKFNV